MSIFKTFSDTIIIILNPQDAPQIQAAREREREREKERRHGLLVVVPPN